MMGVVLPANLLAPRLAERWGAPAVIAAGAIIADAGALGLLGLAAETRYWAMIAPLLALGGGLGLLVPPLTSSLLGRRREGALRHRRRRAQRDAPDVQRARRRPLRRCQQVRRLPNRRPLDTCCGCARPRRGGHRHRVRRKIATLALAGEGADGSVAGGMIADLRRLVMNGERHDRGGDTDCERPTD